MGKLASCTDPSLLTREECDAASMAMSMYGAGGVVSWSNPPVGSFDDFGASMRLLYVISTTDEWEIIMYKLMDSNEPGMAAIRNDYDLASLFAVSWMLLGSFFALNLFVGVVIDQFNRIKAETDGSATMTPAQMQWVVTIKAAERLRPLRTFKPPKGGLRARVFSFVRMPSFDHFITAVIIANISVMACDFWGLEKLPTVNYAYTTAMNVFSIIYYAEAILKITAFGLQYFGDGWCQFDFMLVCTSLIDQFAEELLVNILPVPPMLLRVLRVFRLLRILRLLRGAKELRSLFVTIIISFPSLLNVGAMLSLVTFIYSVIGHQLFTFVKRGDYLTDNVNFDTLGKTGLLLFQCLTGEGWSGLMSDAMVAAAPGGCSSAEGNCGSAVAVPYFISFQVIGGFVFLNLVVAVIIDTFSSVGDLNPSLATREDVEVFKEVWARFDPYAENFIRLDDLPKLIDEMPPPLGIKGERTGIFPSKDLRLAKLIFSLRLKHTRGAVAFSEVLHALAQRTFTEGKVDTEVDLPALAKAKRASVCISSASTTAAMHGKCEAFAASNASDLAKMRLKLRQAEELQPQLMTAPGGGTETTRIDVRETWALLTLQKHTRNFKGSEAWARLNNADAGVGVRQEDGKGATWEGGVRWIGENQLEVAPPARPKASQSAPPAAALGASPATESFARRKAAGGMFGARKSKRSQAEVMC